MSLVLDTDVVSYLFKGDTRADALRTHLVGRLLVVSFMTVAELDRWALAEDWEKRDGHDFKSTLATSSSTPSIVAFA